MPSSSVNDTSVSLLTTFSTFPKTLTYTHEFGEFHKITGSRADIIASEVPGREGGLTLPVSTPSMEMTGSPPPSAAAAEAARQREMWRTVAGTQPE